eukprot:CAMPEP_0174252068 /NCGR_PEP_ID=MMETSP0439-20130205/1699_1 /TAXON_ID=0 /ORGANISM="Stereomyxa ramosa, Strain Chinc5" /LENGTH=173 /DNA_ID=CAMNT_0015332553 /DNA_START=281 /DNA_END=802 /DNA_ORIENTATION=-
MCLHSWKPTIVHRDLKSLNLLVDESWTVKVADFGLSRTTSEDNASTLNKLRGTYAYTAPEVYFGEKYTEKADIFSIAVIIWEIVYRVLEGTYSPPYSEYKHLVFDFQILIQTAKKDLRPSLPDNLPLEIADIITMCWNCNAGVRPTAVELMNLWSDVENVYQNNKQTWDYLLP